MTASEIEELKTLRNSFFHKDRFKRPRERNTNPVRAKRMDDLEKKYIVHLQQGGQPLFEVTEFLLKKLLLPKSERW